MAVQEWFPAVTSTSYPAAGASPQVDVPFVPDSLLLVHPGGMGAPDVKVSFGPQRRDEFTLVAGGATQSTSIATRAQQLYFRLAGAGSVTLQVVAVKAR